MSAAATRNICARHALRALPLILALAAPPVFASETADVAALLKQMQERLTRLDQRNAELEQRLAQSPAPAADGAKLAARVDVKVELPLGAIGDAQGKLFAHFRAAFGDESGMDLMQAWYQLDIRSAPRAATWAGSRAPSARSTRSASSTATTSPTTNPSSTSTSPSSTTPC
ncbi:MAG: hypothetical protein FD187_2911 [bacterium]|nr:MAG: hypothetical protein FD142_2637 [bacterium]KAF0147291.1 MAG: hypothetical protein FD187_2911 [bacterium]KAF0167212.1 MAG: hypothetical protein FD158_2460 [bacterium]TXT17910.1 MAG: hypothetical protein FD132_2260 [bacterium]